MRFSVAATALVVFLGGASALDKPVRLASIVSCASSPLTSPQLNIQKLNEVECTTKTKEGDKVDVHYRGTLEADGSLHLRLYLLALD